jgi:uncharacterized protein (TIGR01777 family)
MTQPPQHIVIAGGTGMIGRALIGELFAQGHNITVLSRGSARGKLPRVPRARVAAWNPGAEDLDLDALGTVDVVVNLAGASLSRMPWTASRRAAILGSRLDATNTIVDAIHHARSKPAVLINASAVGIYGNRGNETLDESSSIGSGFLADVVRQWEDAARAVDPAVRLVLARTGIVIGPEGALTPLRRLGRFSLAGPLGNGKQWWPWIGLRDEVRALIFVMDTRGIKGPINIVGPEPATQRTVVRSLGRRMHRASWVPVPKFALRILLGGAADEMLLSSQKVVPSHLVASGFTFDDPKVDRAIARALLETDRRVK